MNQARKRVCGCWSPQVGSHSGRAAFHGPLVRILPRCPHLGSFGAVRAILPANPFWGVLWSAARGRRGRAGTLHCTLRMPTAGGPLERKLLFRLRPNSRTVRRAALRSYLGSAHGLADAVQETVVPFILPQAVCVHGAINPSRWIVQTRRRRCPRFHTTHLVSVAGDQVVDVANGRGGFKRNRHAPRSLKSFVAAGLSAAESSRETSVPISVRRTSTNSSNRSRDAA